MPVVAPRAVEQEVKTIVIQKVVLAEALKTEPGVGVVQRELRRFDFLLFKTSNV